MARRLLDSTLMIGVLIVDDSSVARQVLRAHLEMAPGIEVIDAAMDPLFAMGKMARRWPEVILLDIEMPRMDGLSFLRKVMAERPTPVIIASTLTERGTATSLEALALGAVAVFSKASLGIGGLDADPLRGRDELIRAIRTAAQARAMRPAAVVARSVPRAAIRSGEHVVAIGTSTGGTQALEAVLRELPADAPGMVVVQHMPAQFTAAFAQRLNGLTSLEVLEAQGGERVKAGRVLIAPGGRHLQLARSGGDFSVVVVDAPPVNRHCPSVDVLFKSVAKIAGPNATGIIMTGMGDDGARGLREMRDAGAQTWAQDEASCVVFGMPREAIRLGAAQHVVSLDEIPGVIGAAGGRSGGR